MNTEMTKTKAADLSGSLNAFAETKEDEDPSD